MPLDITGLKPLDTSGLTPVAPDAAGLNVSGLKPLDVSGLTPASPPDNSSLSDYPVEFGKGTLEGAKNLGASALKGYAALDAGAARNLLDVADRIDRGERVQPGDDLISYSVRSPEQRQAVRAELQAAIARPLKEHPLYRAGTTVEDFGKETLAPKPGFEGSWTRDIGSGLGSMAAGMGLSLIPMVGPEVAAATFLGSGSGEAVDTALQKGATDEQAIKAAQFGTVPGMTDVVDILLPQLGTTGKVLGFIRRVGKRAVQGALAEGGQEGVQQLMQNAIAIGIYDPNRDIMQDVPRSAAIGAILGGGAGGGFAAIDRGPAAQQQPAPAQQTADAVQQGIPPGAIPAETVLSPEVPGVSSVAVNTPVAPLGAPLDGGAVSPDASAGIPPPQGQPPAAPGLPMDTATVEGQPVANEGEPLPPPSTRPLLESILNDPRPADEIRAEMEAAKNWRPTDQWQMVPKPVLRGYDDLNDFVQGGQVETRVQGDHVYARLPPAPGTRQAPVQLEAASDPNLGAEQTVQPKSMAQAEAGNYRKRHVEWFGLKGAVETEAGQERTGIGPDGVPWSVVLNHPYGEFKQTEGKDGDPVDFYVGPHPESDRAVVIDQIDPDTRKFDEHKVVIGVQSGDQALAVYNSGFSDGSAAHRLGAAVEMSAAELKTWLEQGDTKKPLGYTNPPVNRAPKGPLSLFQFLAKNGGIRDQGGELRHLGLDRQFVPSFGRLVRESGKALDRAREAAVEAGYLQDAGAISGGNPQSYIDDLLEALDSEARGDRVYSIHDVEAAQARESQRQEKANAEELARTIDEVRDLAKTEGINATDQELEAAARYALVNNTDLIDGLVTVIEQSYYAAHDEVVALEPQEQPNEQPAANVSGRSDQGGAGSAPASEQSARPETVAAPEPAARGEQSGQAQQPGSQTPVEPVSAPAVEMYLEIGEKRYQISDYKDASDKVSAAREKLIEQGGDIHAFAAPSIVDSNGKVIAHVSWNGRVWPGRPGRPGDPGDWTPDTKPLYDNRKNDQEAPAQPGPPDSGVTRDSAIISSPSNEGGKINAAPSKSVEKPDTAATNEPPAWFSDLTRAGREELARKALIPQAVRISRMSWGNLSQTVRDKLEAAAGAQPALESNAEKPTLPATEPSDGLQTAVPPGDAAASATNVQEPVQDRPVGESRPGEGGGSGADVQGSDGQRAERPDRLSEGAVREGSRGTGESRLDRVSEGSADNGGAGREEHAASAARSVEGENFLIAPGALDEGRSFKTKAEDNINAIELLRRIEAEGRPATRAEQEQLARYVGWGGIKGAFPDADGKFGKGFEKIGEKLKELLSDTEYTTARRSIQYAHYTAEDVVRSMWSAAERLGFSGGKVFEPGMGVGNFAGMMSPDIAQRTQYVGLELDHTTAAIAKLLYPKWGVRRDDFTKAPLPENTFDLVIGNPPFADVAIKSDPKYAKHGFLLHDYFFAKSLDAVRPGGVLAFISSAGTMNKKDTAAREYLADRADLVGAIRLPSNAFAKNAGTEVTTDIVILRKRLPDEAPGDRSWTETTEVKLPNKEGKTITGLVNRYFADHPEMVLGEQGFFDKLYLNRYAVHGRPGQDLKADLASAIDNLPADVMSAWHGPIASGDEDFGTSEKKEGSFYVGPKGGLMQMVNGVGVPIERRGKGVEGGRTAADIERISALVPVRDALRAVYDADLAGDTENSDRARARLNKTYDGFVEKFGPINKAVLQRRRPNTIQQEAARNEAREEARYAGQEFNEGSFDPTMLIAEGKSLSEISRARQKARDEFKAAGRTFDEGSFDPDEMPDVIIDKRPNVDPFMDDPESYRLRAIERYDDSTNTATKGPVFFENLITKERKPEINSLDDAVLYVLNQHGRLDIGQISKLINKSDSETIQALGDRIYKEPGTRDGWVTKDEYLSGNVRKKLLLAKDAAERNPEFRRNVEALEAAQPMPLPPSQIHASLGMPWIPQETVKQFAKDALDVDIKVVYIPSLAQWVVSGETDSTAASSTWGTSRRQAPALLKDVLNHQQSKIYDTYRDESGKTRTELNVEATQAAQEKAQAIKDKFDSWIWSDESRADTLSKLYNETYNNLVVRQFDGNYLTTPGISKHWSWRPHQTRVVARIIQQGNTYMAHAVGAGKTSAMIGAGMEMRRLGLVRKPMYSVPNHMLGQFTKEFYEQYPTAKIAVADERRFHTDRRKQFIANVAVEDLDAVIITHSAMGMIPVSPEFQDGVIQTEIAHYREVLSQIPKDNDNRITRGRIEKQIERLEQRLTGKSNRRRDQVFTFEQMGVDFLFVDEAHLFRKLDFTTQMSNLKGITPEGSSAAWDLYVKTLYLDSINPGRSLVMASGTPVTNTMAELYTLSRFMQRQELEERGLAQFDAWAGAFGESVTELEQDAAGGYKPVSRFAKFVNVAELSALVRQVMDVVTSRQLEQYVTRPTLKTGKRIMHLAEKTPALERFQRTLAKRMEAIAARKGPPKKGDDIMLSVINDGRHAAIDLRLAGIEPDGKSKLDLMIDNVFRIWKETKQQKFYRPKAGGGGYEATPFDSGPATQMIFANLGLSGARGFSVPDYIRSDLARRGVPRDQIAYIYNYKSHVARQKLFNDMNEGKVRILIGSTAKMATGVNAQRRLYAIHNQDPLWYPADDEQRNGRGIRQGNLNPEIEINDYSTKGTYDSTMWGLMEKKARFIQGFFEGDPSMRDMEDLGEASQYAQAKAITTNDPRLIKLTELKNDLERARRRKAGFEQEVYAMRQRRASAVNEREYYAKRITDTEQDIQKRQDTSGDNFTAKIGTTTFDKRADFGAALMERFDEIAAQKPYRKAEIKVGEIGGFPFYAQPRKFAETVIVDAFIKRSGDFETDVEVGRSAVGVVRSAEAALQRFERDLSEYKERRDKATKFLAESEAAAGKKFSGDDEIAALETQVREIEADIAKPTTPVDKAIQEDLIRASSLEPLETLGVVSLDHYRRPARPVPAEKVRPAGMFSLRESNENTAPKLSARELRTPFTEEFTEHREQVYPLLRSELDRLGLPQVALRLPDSIELLINGKALTADGHYLRSVITIALDGTGKFETLHHEALHALRRLGLFKDGEWSILTRRADAKWHKQFNVGEDYAAWPQDKQAEEAIARAYAAWANSKLTVDGRIARLFKRIRDFFERVGNALRGAGFKAVEDVFHDVKSGQVGARSDSGKKLSGLGAFAVRSADGDLFKSEIVETVDGPREQLVIPGAERISDRQRAEREGARPKRSSKTQKTIDGLPLFDGEPDPDLPLFALRSEPETAIERHNVEQGFLQRGQFMDRALRVPFDFFGGVTRDGTWKPGQYLFDKASNVITKAEFSPEGRFAFLNPIMETARTGLVDRYSLRDMPDYVDRERKRSLDERAVMLEGAEILKSLKDHGVGPEEARVLQAMLTGEDVASADMEKLAEPIRAAIDQLGQEAVALGMVSPESFERNRGTYLHRVYQKYESEQSGLARTVNNIMGSRRKKIIGDQFKARGLFQEIDVPRLMKDVPGWKDAARGKPQNGEKFVRLDEPQNQAVIDRVDETDATGRNLVRQEARPLRTVYWPAEKAIPDKYNAFRNQGTWEVRGVDGNKITLWRDFTKEERTKMGEILDARYTIGKTFMLMAHDLANGRFYKDIAENEGWTLSATPNAKWLDASEWSAQRRRFTGKGEVEWVKVPDAEIPNSGGKKKWGALSGKWVREEIWRDLNELQIMQRPNLWRSLLTQWKLNKTARSPVVHMNNVMSNFVLMDMIDVRFQDFAAGIRSYLKGDEAYQEAFQHGAFGADMISQEVRDQVLKPILEELERDNTYAQGGHMGALGQVSKFTESLWSKIMKLDKAMLNAYRLEDEVFRMATYMRRRQLGDDPAQAAEVAREQFIDYDIRAPWVNAARNSVLPFISYTYRAAPMVARAIATRPWKLGKYFLLTYMLNALAYALTGDDDEDKKKRAERESRERRSMRDEEQGYSWLGTPRMLRLPVNDRYNNPLFLDIRRWVPASDIFDTQGNDMPAWANLGGPLMIGAELFLNRSAFTGDEIVNKKTDDLWDRMNKRGEHLYKSWMPSAAWVPGSWYWTKVENAVKGATDAQGRPYSTLGAVSNAFGIKVKPQDVENGRFWKAYEFSKVEQALKAEAGKIVRQHKRGLISDSAFNRAMNDIMAKRERLNQKRQEVLR